MATYATLADTDTSGAVSARVRRYCGWHIAPVVTETVTLRGSGLNRVFLPTLHLASVASVTDDGTVLDMATVYTDPAGYLERSDLWKVFGSRPSRLVVTFTHGYTLTEVPDVVQIVADAAARNATLPMGMRQRAVGQVSGTYLDPGLLSHELAQLDAYRIPRIR